LGSGLSGLRNPELRPLSTRERATGIDASVVSKIPDGVYRWGRAGRGEFDCSGLVYEYLHNSGMAVQRTTAEGYRKMFPDAPSQVSPGDLIFFDFKKAGRATHVGIFVGRDAQGKPLI